MPLSPWTKSESLSAAYTRVNPTKVFGFRGVLSRPRHTVGSGRQGRTSQGQRGKLSSGRGLTDAHPSQIRNPARRFPLRQGRKPVFFVLFPATQGSQNSLARSSPQLAPVTPQGGCRPARAIVRAVTATKQELGLLPLHRVVSYGSTLEVRALLMRLSSHHQRARGEALAVVPPLRAAWTRCLPVAISAAQQSPNFRCVHRNIYHRFRTCQFFRRPIWVGGSGVGDSVVCWVVWWLGSFFFFFEFSVFSFSVFGV